MSYPIIRTKVVLPARQRYIISRGRLLALLDDLLEFRLTLISAPAGYGKTSLLVDLAAGVEYPVCWLALDPLDADPIRFLHYLIAAVRQNFPEFGEASSALVSAQAGSSLDWDRIRAALVNDLYENIEEHFVIVLDDYHLVDHSPEINQFINGFVQEMDDNCHLVIASRQLLALEDLPLLIGRSQVMGLSFEELAFLEGEIRQLYSLRYGQEIDAEAAESIRRSTEGWITGLLLSAEAGPPGSKDHGRAARSAGIDIYDYLAQQVFDKQPPELQDFMLKTSLLEEFDAGLCQQALGEPPGKWSWEALLEEVFQRNLFIQPVEDRGTWLRYHHLLRDFLQQRYQMTFPEQARGLNLKLVEVYRDRKWFEKAYAALSRLGDDQLKADFITEASSDLIHTGQISLLDAWVNELPRSLIYSQLSLVNCKAGILIMTGDPGSGVELIDTVLDDPTLERDPSLKAELLIRRSTCQRMLGNCQDGFENAARALEIAGKINGKSVLRAEAEREIGLNLLRLGRTRESKKHLERSLASYLKQKDSKNAAFLQVDLGYLEMYGGMYQRAKGLFNRAYQVWEELGNIDRLVGLGNNLGMLAQLCGEYQEAYAWFSRSLDFARQTANRWEKGFTLASLGDLCLDLKALSEADEYFQKAKQAADEVGDSYLQVYLILSEAALARRRGDLPPARRNLSRAKDLLGDLAQGYEAGRYQLELGLVKIKEEDPAGAALEFEAARQIFNDLDQPAETGRALLYLAWADCQLGQADQAGARMEAVRQLVKKLGTIQPLVPSLAGSEELVGCIEKCLPPGSFRKQIQREAADFRSDLPAIREKLGFSSRSLEAEVPPALEIQALGRISLRIRGEKISAPEWIKQKTVRELFFYLLTCEEGALREEICLEFWPDSTAEQLKKQFKNAIYRLRRAVGKDTITLDPATRLYQINRGLDYRYDVEEYLAAVEAGEREKDPGKKVQLLEKAISLYRHPFAPTLDGIWTEPVRYRLYLDYERAVIAVVNYQLAQGDLDQGLDLVEGLVKIQPGQEEGWRLMMRIFSQKSDRSGIERAYQRCLIALSQDLDTEPSPETIALYQDLMS